MPKYQVLITLNEFREVTADSAKQAQELMQQLYMDGHVELSSMPEFVCEECDSLEEVKTKKFTVKAYHSVIKDCNGEEYAVDIGVVEPGTPLDAYWDSWIDPRIYFNMGQDELDSLEVGDEIAEGDTLMEIDKENFSVWEAEYNPADYKQEEGVY